ncbi:MAG: OsmC family protein [Oscillochloridaceae bacterium umkhey_bin13]
MPPTWTLPEYLERKRVLVDAYREQLRQPEAAPAPLRAVVSVAAGSGVRPIRMRDFLVTTDAGAPIGGYGLGPTAPELLLGALASCLAHSAVVIAADHKMPIEQLEVEVTGQLDYRGTLAVEATATVPPTKLAYQLRVSGPLSDQDLARLHADLEQLCPVLLALTQPTAVSGQIERVG